MPGTANDLAAALVTILAGTRGLHQPGQPSLAEAAALVRTAVAQREELTAEVEHHDGAPGDRHQLAAARRDLGNGSDDVLGHRVFRSAYDPKSSGANALSVVPDFAAKSRAHSSREPVQCLRVAGKDAVAALGVERRRQRQERIVEIP